MTLQVVYGFWDRWQGFRRPRGGCQFLFFPRCRAVHTFGMDQPLTLLWVDKNLAIQRVDRRVPPNRIRWCRGAYGVIECRVSSHSPNKKLIWDDNGQALVETALILPLMLLFVFGFLQLSLAISAQQKLTHTANYAAQVGAMTNDDAKITGAVSEWLDETDVTVAIESRSAATDQILPDGERRFNDLVKVQLRQPFALNIPFLDLSPLTLSAASGARILCSEHEAPYTCD